MRAKRRRVIRCLFVFRIFFIKTKAESGAQEKRVNRTGLIGFDPPAAPLRDVTLRNINIKQADRTFVLKNVEGLKLENVTIGGQRVDGRLDWRLTAARP